MRKVRHTLGPLSRHPAGVAGEAKPSLSILQRIAQPRGALVILVGDRLLQLFLERRVNVVLLPERRF